MSTSTNRTQASKPAPLSRPGNFARDARAPRGVQGRDDGWVSPTVARLEPWVSWSLAAYTAWIALFSFPDLPALWLFVLYAVVLGKWCDLSPSRRQGRMFVHGTLLLCGAYFLHTHLSDRLGGAGGLFFFWAAIVTLAYAFMLRPRWAAGIVALGAFEFMASGAVLGTLGASAISQVGFLLLFPLVLAMPFGEAMRKPDLLVERTRIDSATGLLNREGLLIHGDDLLHACHREKRPVAVAVFGCDDLLALREMYGRTIARQALDLLVEKFQAIAGSRGLVARTGTAEFSLLLPGLNRDKAVEAIARHLGNPLMLEFDVPGKEIVIAPVVVLEAARANEPSIEGLLAELTADMHILMAVSRQEEATGSGQSPTVQAAAGHAVVRRATASASLTLADESNAALMSMMPTMPAALEAR